MNHGHDASNPADREQLRQELLELHFGCHEDPAQLEARLAAEPALRALQQEVLAQANLLTAAVRPEQAPLRLESPRATERATPRALPQRRWWHSPLRRLQLATGTAAATVLGFFAHEQWAASAHTQFQREHLHLTVSAPRAVPAGAPWSFTVQAADLRGEPIDGKVTWQAFAANGALLASSETAVRAGTATVAMVPDSQLQVPSRLLVAMATATDRVEQMLPLSTAAAGPLVHVSTDRPVYRPGEPVFVRAVVLDRVTRLPLPGQQQLVAQLCDAKGAPIANDYDQGAPGGVGSFRFEVPAGSAGGPHTIVVQSPNGAFPPERADIVVRTFQPPQLQKRIELDRSSYAPGARGAATVTVARLAAGGGGASGASCKAALVLDGTEVWSEKRALGAQGDATFAFVVPKDVAQGAARFVATIDDSGIVETEVKPFLVPTGKVLLAAYPEGGELVAGVDNAVYLECTDPLGRPVAGAGEVLDERDRQVAKFRTLHQGRAKVAFVPKPLTKGKRC